MRAHTYRIGIPGNLELTFIQLSVLKLFMSEGTILPVNTVHTYGGVVSPGYFVYGGTINMRSGRNYQLLLCGPTNKNTAFYKVYSDRVLRYRNDNFNLHIPSTFNRPNNYNS